MQSSISTRKAFGQTLAKLGEINEDIVCLDADLSHSTQSYLFADKFPDRFFQMGIQEANMIGVAAGLSFEGKIPFACSFAAFITGRFDQIRISIAYSRANVKLIGTHVGVGIGEDGHTQMGLEDVTLMRSLPQMTVLIPGDAKECSEMVAWAAKHQGPVYLRLTRQDIPVYNMQDFSLGTFPKLKSGKSIAFLASGPLLSPALEAAKELSLKGKVEPAVFNLNCAKPLDSKFMATLSDSFETFVVFEDHTIIGGLASMIAEWMSQYSNLPRRVIAYGVPDVFGESAPPEKLYEKYGFTKDAIVKNFA